MSRIASLDSVRAVAASFAALSLLATTSLAQAQSAPGSGICSDAARQGLAHIGGWAETQCAAATPASTVVLKFTKWVTVNPGDPYMQGVVTGEGIVNAPGPYNFTGQVLARNATQLVDKLGGSCQPPLCGDVMQLEAVYEVQSGEHSFRSYLQGAYDNLSNRARLDGYVLGGWLAGQPVHVEFQVSNCAEPNAAGGICYDGTITING